MPIGFTASMFRAGGPAGFDVVGRPGMKSVLKAAGLAVIGGGFALAGLVTFDYFRSAPLESIERQRFAIPADGAFVVSSVRLEHRLIAPVVTIPGPGRTDWLDFGAATFGGASLTLGGDDALPLTVELRERLKTERGPANQFAVGHLEISDHFQPGVNIISAPARHLPREGSLPLGLEGILPFRYARISGLPSGVEVSLQKVEVRFPFAGQLARFESSSSELNAVWELCRQTVLNTGYGGLFLDGNRERLPYEADAHINLLAQFAVVPDPRLARATILHLAENPTWPIEWAFEFISLVRAYWQYTGDADLLLEVYPHLLPRVFPERWGAGSLLVEVNGEGLRLGATDLKPIIDWPAAERAGFVTERDPEMSVVRQWAIASARSARAASLEFLGLPTLAYYQRQRAVLEWERLWRIPPDNLVVQARYLQSLRELAEIATVVGDESTASQLWEQASRVHRFLFDHYYDGENQAFRDVPGQPGSSFHSALHALLAGLYPGGDEGAVLEYLDVNRHRASVYSAHYLLRAFYQNGKADLAFEYMTAETRRSWLGMLGSGASMTTEAWSDAVKPNMDWNHPWGASPAHHIVAGVVGLTPSAAGFAEIDLVPQPYGLKWFEYEGETPVGRVFLRYESQPSEDLYRVELPANTQAVRMILTSGHAAHVRPYRGGTEAFGDWEPVRGGAVALSPGGRYEVRVVR